MIDPPSGSKVCIMNIATAKETTMKSTFNIADAQDDIKALNDYLLELGEQMKERNAEFAELEKLYRDPEFLRLMKNIHYFATDGHKYMAEIYANLAKMHAGSAEAEN